MWRMTWQASSVRPYLRHVMCFRLSQETRVYSVEDDVAGFIYQTLTPGAGWPPWRATPPACSRARGAPTARGRGLHSSTCLLVVCTLCGIRWVVEELQ